MTGVSIFCGLSLAFTGLTLLRYRYALAEIRAQKVTVSAHMAESDITVLQPILGGDPALAGCLENNLRNAPAAHFVWLIDSDDGAGQEAAQHARAATGRNDIALIIAATPPRGCNPKTYKLAAGMRHVTTAFVAVLDDDTVLNHSALGKAMAKATQGVLVTGLPFYAARKSWLERFVTGFVNGNAVLTYLPAARAGITRTINGMFSVMRTGDLQIYGGFDSFVNEVTDDYALARLFLSRGGCIKQTCIPLSITTTVNGVRHYFALMRRWCVFAGLYLRENISVGMFFLVLLPGLLPLPLVIAGLNAGFFWAFTALLLLAMKAVLIRTLAQHLDSPSPYLPLSDIVFEVLSDILLPAHIIAATLRPNQIHWRKHRFVLKGREIIDG